MDGIQVATYSLVVRVLLVTSGLEENPGPETQNAREVEQLEDWECLFLCVFMYFGCYSVKMYFPHCVQERGFSDVWFVIL